MSDTEFQVPRAALTERYSSPSITSEVCVVVLDFSCDGCTWWEFDLVYRDSCQATKPIIIPSKILVKL